jgi:hypothetical protein
LTVYAFIPTKSLEAGRGSGPEHLTVMQEEVDGQTENYVPFFGDESRAGRTLEMFLNLKFRRLANKNIMK